MSSRINNKYSSNVTIDSVKSDFCSSFENRLRVSAASETPRRQLLSMSACVIFLSLVLRT